MDLQTILAQAKRPIKIPFLAVCLRQSGEYLRIRILIQYLLTLRNTIVNISSNSHRNIFISGSAASPYGNV